ncbi:porin family protein [Cytophagaceae bacterium ABcell3]|nr:porin family protein [Cytophagaceae bacterium ABcell3]
MKKFLLVCACCIFFVSEGFSQTRIGLRFSPGLAFSRGVDQDLNDHYDVSGSGAGIRFFAGPEISHFFGDNYAFVTGVWFASKRGALNVEYENISLEREVYNLQYLQIPLTMRLYTNEIATNTQLYFQLGATGDIKIGENPVTVQSPQYITNFRFFDASLVIGTGIQLQMGSNTYLLGGITYMRGLINAVTDVRNVSVPEGVTAFDTQPSFRMNNDMITIDLGIMF